MLSATSGCSKNDMNQAIETAKTKTKLFTKSAVEVAKENLPKSGTITLRINHHPIAISMAQFELISIGDGRPNVIQITTYDSNSSSRFYPALLLHGVTDISMLSELPGKSISCDVYYQASETAPIAIALPGESMTVDFQKYNPTDKSLLATLGMISLCGSDDSVVQIEGGTVLAVLREETK